MRTDRWRAECRAIERGYTRKYRGCVHCRHGLAARLDRGHQQCARLRADERSEAGELEVIGGWWRRILGVLNRRKQGLNEYASETKTAGPNGPTVRVFG